MLRHHTPTPLVTPTHIHHIQALQDTSFSVLISAYLLKQITSSLLKPILKSTSIIVFEIETEESLDVLKRILSRTKRSKVVFLSTQLRLLAKMERLFPDCRRVYKSINPNWTANELIVYLNRYRIRTIMLEPALAPSLCHSLRKHALSVWSHAVSQTQLHDLIISGVQSISVPYEDQVQSLLSEYNQLRMLLRPVFIAHRGASQLKQENTLPAFTFASCFGADVLETDIRQTKDGQLVLFHDPTLKRLTGDKRRVAQVSLKEMRALTPVVELETFLATYQHSSHTLLLEIKEEPIVPKVVELIDKYELWHQVHIQSFLPNVLKTIQALQPQLGVSLLYSHNKGSKVHLSKKKVQKTLLTTQASFNPKIRRSNRLAKQQDGLQSFYWTIRTKQELEKQWSQGVPGLIMDCIHYIQSYPVMLKPILLPYRNREGSILFPEKAQSIFSDGSNEWVLVDWFIQTKTDLIRVTNEDKLKSEVYVFCRYRVLLNGKHHSICSKLIHIK